jgi:carbon storage regulator CsrA
MLVLSRKPGEKVVIDNAISLTIVEVQGNRVRIGIEAPDHVRILRGELAWWQNDSHDADRAGEPDWSRVAENGLELKQTRELPRASMRQQPLTPATASKECACCREA